MRNKNTILAFDFGTKNIGVAIGQRNTSIAFPLCVIKTRRGILDLVSISSLLNEWQPYKIVIGLPLNMDGTEQPLTLHVRKFAKIIHSYFNIEVNLHDERLSTYKAKTMLFEYGGFRVLSKRNINSIAAMIILDSYLTQYYRPSVIK